MVDSEGPEPYLITLSAEAAERRREYHNTLEAVMAEGEEYEDVRDIASKATTHTTKIAACFHRTAFFALSVYT